MPPPRPLPLLERTDGSMRAELVQVLSALERLVTGESCRVGASPSPLRALLRCSLQNSEGEIQRIYRESS